MREPRDGRGYYKRIDVAPGPVELRIDKPASSDYLIRWDARQPLDIPSLGPYEGRTVMVINAQPPGAQLVIDAEVIDWVAKLPTTTRFVINVGGTSSAARCKTDTHADTDTSRHSNAGAHPIAWLACDAHLRITRCTAESPEGSIRRDVRAAYSRLDDGQLCCGRCQHGRVANDRQRRSLRREGDAHWKAASMRPRRSLPWVIISNGTTNRGYEGPVPEKRRQISGTPSKV